MLKVIARLWKSFRARLERGSSHRAGVGSLLEPPIVEAAATYEPFERLVLSDEVSRTLFAEYAQHRKGKRREEEIGWVLLGHREAKEAVVLATLPAGALREAGIAHIRFNAQAQALASRILRQADRRLTILGIVHTHPGSLRHPSKGDFQGDRQWVRLLRGQEGIFGIGTVDRGADPAERDLCISPQPHVQCYDGLRFTWYSLHARDKHYRPLPVALTLGSDLALPLHAVWNILEVHAARLERLWSQLSRLQFQVQSMQEQQILQVSLAIDKEVQLRVLMSPEKVTYTLWRSGELLVCSLQESCVDRGVYLLLAELAADKAG